MMLTTPENIAEAKRALREYMERSRRAAPSHRNTPQRTFAAGGGTDTDLVTDANRERILTEARESARRFCEARAKNARPPRQVDVSNPAAVEGQLSALDWLMRKGKSRRKR